MKQGDTKAAEKLACFATRLRVLRAEKDWTAEFVAEKIGLTKGQISNYENGVKEPGFITVLRLAELFDEEPGYLMCETDSRKLKKTV